MNKDVLGMTVKECLADPKAKALIDKYIPDLSKYPVALFNRKKVSELVDMAIKQKMFTAEDAKEIVGKINAELNK